MECGHCAKEVVELVRAVGGEMTCGPCAESWAEECEREALDLSRRMAEEADEALYSLMLRQLRRMQADGVKVEGL